MLIACFHDGKPGITLLLFIAARIEESGQSLGIGAAAEEAINLGPHGLALLAQRGCRAVINGPVCLSGRLNRERERVNTSIFYRPIFSFLF